MLPRRAICIVCSEVRSRLGLYKKEAFTHSRQQQLVRVICPRRCSLARLCLEGFLIFCRQLRFPKHWPAGSPSKFGVLQPKIWKQSSENQALKTSTENKALETKLWKQSSENKDLKAKLGKQGSENKARTQRSENSDANRVVTTRPWKQSSETKLSKNKSRKHKYEQKTLGNTMLKAKRQTNPS